MNTYELESRIISVHKVAYGTWWVKTMKRGKIVVHTTHDASAIDRYYDHQYNDVRPMQRSNRYTYKEALKALYREQ